jgi:hypothetical protein
MEKGQAKGEGLRAKGTAGGNYRTVKAERSRALSVIGSLARLHGA